MDDRVFVYGSLMDKSKRKYILGRRIRAKRTILCGYDVIKKIRVRNGSYYTAEPVPGGTLAGMVFGVRHGDLEKLDEWETGAFHRIAVTLFDGKTAQMYVESASRHIRDGLAEAVQSASEYG